MRLPLSSPLLAERTWPAWPSFSDDDGGSSGPDEDLQNWSSLIGIITAICGNVLIALALNVQRYAHIRLHRKRRLIRERARQAMKNAVAAGRGQGTAGMYGAAGTSNGGSNGGVSPSGSLGNGSGRYSDDNDSRGSSETDPLAQSFRSDSSGSDDDDATPKVASTYLKDPYWWLGQVLITVGEMGNFLAYGFAPASIVSPLGVVALVSNCVIAPLFFNEVFRPRDFWGVIIAITGAVTVVLSAKTEETKMGPHEVWDAITTIEFEIYMGVSCGLIVLLMWLSPRYGNRTILIDLGLVGLFGGYTALATKGVSSMLSSTLLGAFTTPVTYALLFILLFTAIMQVRYLNKALQRFDSTQVIPIQFVMFTLCVIIGSAVLYRDFERTTGEQAIKFVGGCLFTFFGVFLITSGRPRHDVDDEDTLSDAEGIDETIGLAEQDRAAPPTPQSRRDTTPKSRGSSRASYTSFKATTDKPLPPLPSTGYPTPRVPTGAANHKPLPIDEDDHEDDDEDAPLLGNNPWADEITSDRPILGPHTISSDSIPSAVPSTPPSTRQLIDTEPTLTPQTHLTKIVIPSSTGTTPPRAPHLLAADRPQTPRAPASTSRLPVLSTHVYSPSPFSSTLGAVVADKLLAHIGGGVSSSSSGSGSSVPGRNRPGLRGSLFGPFVQEPEAIAGDVEGGTGVGGSYNAEGNTGNNGAGHAVGLRGRARSLSYTLGLGGLWRGSQGQTQTQVQTLPQSVGDGGDSRNDGAGAEEPDGAVLARARTAGAASGSSSSEGF